MNVEFTGRNTPIYPRLKEFANTELDRIDKMLGRTVSAHVILSEDKYRKIAEVTLQTTHETLVAECEGKEMMDALHDTLKKIEQQAIKHKERKATLERHAKPDSAEPLIEVPAVS